MSAFVSVAELFSIGVGPSSSHTVGPMRAARAFVVDLREAGLLSQISRIEVALYGSLGATGLGHGTPDAVVAGLRGERPESVDPAAVIGAWSKFPRSHSENAADDERLLLSGQHEIDFAREDIQLEPRTILPGHPNGMRLRAWFGDGEAPIEAIYYSIGGGFIRREGEGPRSQPGHPLPYESSVELLELCHKHGLDHARIAWANECAVHGEAEAARQLDAIWQAMTECVEAGLRTDGMLPGRLGVTRRAAKLARTLRQREAEGDDVSTTDWLQAFAMAVNEENAAGGRVVTAPTNGAAGIIPAVGLYYLRFAPGAELGGIRRYLLTAAAIGSVIKANASISGAEGGCQAEVGSACAMAAAGVCALLGGSPEQVENAAEIAIEHHLGLTCDPVGGLVQVPCIERNAIAASTAIAAARLARNGDGSHIVSLDTVIETMRQTGLDMSTKYKETSEGGLAVNVVEC